MSKKQWYVANIKNTLETEIIYTDTKLQAENLNKTYKDSYIDFVWKQDIKTVPFSKLHGKKCIKAS